MDVSHAELIAALGERTNTPYEVPGESPVWASTRQSIAADRRTIEVPTIGAAASRRRAAPPTWTARGRR